MFKDECGKGGCKDERGRYVRMKGVGYVKMKPVCKDEMFKDECGKGGCKDERGRYVRMMGGGWYVRVNNGAG